MRKFAFLLLLVQTVCFGKVGVTGNNEFKPNDFTTISTCSATTTVLETSNCLTYAMEDDSVINATMLCAAINDGKDSGVMIERRAAFIRVDEGDVAVVGSPTTTFKEPAASALALTAELSGANITFQVTGIALENFNWRCKIEIVRSSI